MSRERADQRSAEATVTARFDDVAELREEIEDPFVRWCLPRTGFLGAWQLDAAHDPGPV